jgi:Glycosyltransferase
MRICSILTTFTSGGAETLVQNLSRTFTDGGHAASIVAISDAVQVGNPAEVERHMRADMEQGGVTCHSLALANRRNVLAGALALRRVLHEERPDIIHAHTARALPMLALARPGAPIVLTHHNSKLSFHPRAYWFFDRIVMAYVAISEKALTQTRLYARAPVRMIMNAASPRFASGTPRTRPPEQPVILAVGTPSEQKDYGTLIRAAVPLAEQFRAAGRQPPVIRIAGGGAMVEELRSLALQEGAADLVEFLGARSDVDALMRKADLFVNSSLWEGFAIAMIEASMSALPIVATDVAGNHEMVRPGVNGALVPARDPQALAAAIARVLLDPEGYTALSRGALNNARRFSIDRCADEHLRLYRDAMSRNLLAEQRTAA